MAEILREGVTSSRKVRKQTKPSKAARNRRVEDKKYRGVLKQNRKNSSYIND